MQYGRYNPKNPENSATLFSYQEVPVTSTKMNRWNGNLAAAFELLHRVCGALFAKNGPAVITSGGADSLKVAPADAPDMTVRVNPGWAVLQSSFAGLGETVSAPQSSAFAPPASQPRIDLVVLTGDGEIGAIQGEEAETPAVPDAPDDSIVLARIYQRSGAAQILAEDDGVQSYIIDARPRMLLGEAHHHGPDNTPSEPPDGTRQQFSTQNVFRSGSLEVYVNGVMQHKNVDFTEDADRKGYTFAYSPMETYKIQHRYILEYELT